MEILLEILEKLHPDIDFKTCDNLVDTQVLDSFDIIVIVTEISSEFDVYIPAEEITPENFNSAKSLYSLVERLLDKD